MEALETQDRIDLQETSRKRRIFKHEIQETLWDIPDSLFEAHYQLSKDMFRELCQEIRPFMPPQQRNSKVSIECKILTALWFYATGSHQIPVGLSYLHELSQSNVSTCIKEVTEALNSEEFFKRHVSFPQSSTDRMRIVNGFARKFGMPGVLGCIDATHVTSLRPSESDERIFNRKQSNSRKVQIICDSDLNIMDVNPSYGGTTHEAFIWRNCHLNDHMQVLHRTEERLWLLGDSEYPLRPWLMTPIINATCAMEENYTNVHYRTKNCVVKCIDVLKTRWRCLQSHRLFQYQHVMVGNIINACVVLHNIANKSRFEIPQGFHEEKSQDATLQAEIYQESSSEFEQGIQQRNAIVCYLWCSRSSE